MNPNDRAISLCPFREIYRQIELYCVSITWLYSSFQDTYCSEAIKSRTVTFLFIFFVDIDNRVGSQSSGAIYLV